MKLPVVSGAEAIRVFERIGYVRSRQRSSHVRLHHPHPADGQSPVLSVPDHREVRAGTLRGLIRDAGLTVERFIELL